MAAISDRIFEREAHRHTTLALGVFALGITLARFAIFAYGIRLTQTSLVGLLIGSALLLYRLGSSVQLRHIGTLLVFEILVQGILVRGEIANRLPIDIALSAHLLF